MSDQEYFYSSLDKMLPQHLTSLRGRRFPPPPRIASRARPIPIQLPSPFPFLAPATQPSI